MPARDDALGPTADPLEVRCAAVLWVTAITQLHKGRGGKQGAGTSHEVLQGSKSQDPDSTSSQGFGAVSGVPIPAFLVHFCCWLRSLDGS